MSFAMNPRDFYVSSATKFLNSEYLVPRNRVNNMGPKSVSKIPTPMDIGMMRKTMTHPLTPPDDAAGVGGSGGGIG